MRSSRRISVTLDAPDQQAIEVFADHTRPERATLEAWATQHGLSLRDDSDAAVLRTLIRAGAEALREKALEQGYAQLAASRSDDLTERRALRDHGVKRSESRLAE
jgi:hypothetical protein